ncbi:MAG TPA: transketolase [Pyrinomonadaceae bacterium]|jgi:transketolase
MRVAESQRVDLAELEMQARLIRAKLAEMSHQAKTPHLGSSLSCVDILVAAYWGVLAIDPGKPADPDRDRFILSKGHAAPALYAALAYKGFFPVELLDTFTQAGGRLPEQPSPGCVPGMEAATGSLGHGLSLGLGMALAGRLQERQYRIFVAMSDGECNEGSVWEAAMLAPAHGLDNVAVIVDYNKWQATGRSNEIMALSPFRQKWEAFGWSASEVDGHDLDALVSAMSNVPDGSGKPVAIIAHTVKGKGISFMEDDNNWHYRSPNADELRQARVELGLV